MPRFANLKGSMNPFDNNKPVLNSSDRTRNKKSKYIYAAAKQKFQTKRYCNGKNIKYYKKGTVRSVTNYKLQQDLAIGNVLCEDCDDKGLLCKGVANKYALASIHMGNNNVSEFWGGGGLTHGIFTADINDLVQSIAQPVIQADISGVWGPASPPEVSKADLSGAILPDSIPPANMPFGYIDNLIKIPRNLDGNNIVIDPSNILFPDNPCSRAPYLKLSKLKITLVVSAVLPMPIDAGFPGDPLPESDYYKCEGSKKYNNLLNGYTIVMGDATGDDWRPVAAGVIKTACCKRTIDEVSIWNPHPFPPFPLATNPKVSNVGLFDIYIELFSITDYTFLNSVLGISQFFNPDFYFSSNFPFYTFGWPPHTSDFYFHYLQNTVPTAFNFIFQYTIESIRIFQGTCDDNQTTGNKTKQSYMSCLEDGTKKIKFT